MSVQQRLKFYEEATNQLVVEANKILLIKPARQVAEELKNFKKTIENLRNRIEKGDVQRTIDQDVSILDKVKSFFSFAKKTYTVDDNLEEAEYAIIREINTLKQVLNLQIERIRKAKEHSKTIIRRIQQILEDMEQYSQALHNKLMEVQAELDATEDEDQKKVLYSKMINLQTLIEQVDVSIASLRKTLTNVQLWIVNANNIIQATESFKSTGLITLAQALTLKAANDILESSAEILTELRKFTNDLMKKNADDTVKLTQKITELNKPVVKLETLQHVQQKLEETLNILDSKADEIQSEFRQYMETLKNLRERWEHLNDRLSGYLEEEI